MNIAAAWLFNVALQSVLLLIAAWAIERAFAPRNAWRELLWRAALFGGVLTATLQMFSAQVPLAGRWQLTEERTPVASVAPKATPPVAPPTIATVVPMQLSIKQKPLVTTATTTRTPTRLGWPTPRWALAVWIFGALLMLVRTAIRWRRLRRSFDSAAPLRDDDLTADAATIADSTHVAPPALFIMDALPSPVALHGGRIVLPRWAVDSLDGVQLRAMIAHETAHIARRDPQWKMLTAFWRAIFWFVPAAFAQRRLDDLAELACDAFAAASLGNPRGLAECLAVCAEHHIGAHTFDLAPAMAARPSSLMLRIDRLLEGVNMETTTASGTGARAVALLTLVASALALPAIGIDASVAHAAPASNATHVSSSITLSDDNKDKSSISIHSDSDDGSDSTVISTSDDHRSFTANIHGKLTLNDAETEIVDLSPGGTAKLEENVGGTKQRIELSERSGKLERHYFVDNAEHPYDDKARAFMTTVATDMARSGIDGEGRAKRLYAQGGAKRVLDEIGHLHSDYASGIYLRTLLDMGKLAPDDLDRAITLAGNFSSDYERRQTLTFLFDKQPLDAARQVTFLKQVGRFHGDYDRAETLVDVLPRLDDSRPVRQAWLDAARDLSSDYDRRRTYEAMLAHNGMDDGQIATVIEASASMHSDYDRGELLKQAAQRAHNNEAIADRYAKSAEGISSDYTRREALMALIETDHVGPHAAGAVLDAAEHIHSPYDRAQLLIALARVMPTDADLVERYLAVASHLPSAERGEAENALAR
ncbi:MAG TPA: M56 family metallopeptidase [Rudaea sp.]|jgi:beta-lactamase regulating signal transducer with metallopeptidase domain|nr:M56 family metallopeptidase [Rudaea sp.]